MTSSLFSTSSTLEVEEEEGGNRKLTALPPSSSRPSVGVQEVDFEVVGPSLAVASLFCVSVFGGGVDEARVRLMGAGGGGQTGGGEMRTLFGEETDPLAGGDEVEEEEVVVGTVWGTGKSAA